MENNKLKTLINQATTGDNYYQSTITTPISQEELNKLTGASTKLEPLSSPSQGWQCPICGAVMSPWTAVCINCHGNWNYTPQVTFDNWQVTCTSSDKSCGQTTTASHT